MGQNYNHQILEFLSLSDVGPEGLDATSSSLQVMKAALFSRILSMYYLILEIILPKRFKTCCFHLRNAHFDRTALKFGDR